MPRVNIIVDTKGKLVGVYKTHDVHTTIVSVGTGITGKASLLQEYELDLEQQVIHDYKPFAERQFLRGECVC